MQKMRVHVCMKSEGGLGQWKHAGDQLKMMTNYSYFTSCHNMAVKQKQPHAETLATLRILDHICIWNSTYNKKEYISQSMLLWVTKTI